jgi:hypothetical protein
MSSSIPHTARCVRREASWSARSVMLAVRPERIKVNAPGDYALVARLRDAVFQGSKVQLHFEAKDGDHLMVETADLADGLPPPAHRDEARLGRRRHADLPGAMTTKSAPSPWRDPVALLAAPAVIYLLVVYAFPLLWLFMKSLTGPGGLTIQPYVAFLSDPFNWRVIGNTLRVARPGSRSSAS